MKKIKILISNKIHEKGIKILEENNFEVVKNYSISQEELKEEIHKYNGIIVRSGTKLTEEILKKAKNLKVIGRAGVGLDNINLRTAEELGIQVFNTPSAPSVSVAELTIGLLLSLARFISKADNTMHQGKWLKKKYHGFELSGKKIGIIGFGNIGKEVGKRAVAFNMNVGIFDIDHQVQERAKKEGYTVYDSVDTLIKNSQIISLHIPSNIHTKNIINKRRINLMDKDTIIINAARGTLINEEALMDALQKGRIAAAALDVYKQEPLNNETILGYEGDNLILTPHIGSQTEETQIKASIGIAEKLSYYLKNLQEESE
ncbi:MAG: hydroxyacid dehydrogenase [Promethearchaeota archaeon]|nr:MAG: hydroxyacid dehydrogenase [Candidatus Lokiarchaeota archaeon]